MCRKPAIIYVVRLTWFWTGTKTAVGRSGEMLWVDLPLMCRQVLNFPQFLQDFSCIQLVRDSIIIIVREQSVNLPN